MTYDEIIEQLEITKSKIKERSPGTNMVESHGTTIWMR